MDVPYICAIVLLSALLGGLVHACAGLGGQPLTSSNAIYTDWKLRVGKAWGAGQADAGGGG